MAVSQFTSVIEKLQMPCERCGAKPGHAGNGTSSNQSLNMEAAHGRIVDTDMAYDSSRYQGKMCWFRQGQQ